MTFVAKHREWLEPYLHTLQDALGLSHWIIDLDDGWPDNKDLDREYTPACCTMTDSYFRAVIYLSQDTYTPEDLRHYLTHELMHCHLRDLVAAARDATEWLSRIAGAVMFQRIQHEMEQAVDAIATAWIPSLPLPEWSS